jgi:glycosyltransferase involved in cell wall biosynthesis
VYVDDVYSVVDGDGGRRISTDRAFLLFVSEVGRRFERLVLFGRTLWTDRHADYVLPAGIELAPLPHYANLADLRAVVRATFGTVRGMWRGLSRVDTVWVLGPHPFALILIVLAALRRRRIVLGVRQNTLGYYRARLPSPRWGPVLLAVHAMDSAYRALSRLIPTTVVGEEIAAHYGGQRPSLLTMTATLVPMREVGSSRRPRTGSVRLLTVGRLEPEKNPGLLIRALARLEQDHPGTHRLTWIGRGKLEDEIRRLAAAVGVADLFELRGYVPFGPELLELYRSSDVFVHVSLTEGVPQVLVEALATGTPIVATDVGGVRKLLDDGRAGLIVPPDDLERLVSALMTLERDDELRARLVGRGLELAREHTLEAESARVAQFIREGSSRST